MATSRPEVGNLLRAKDFNLNLSKIPRECQERIVELARDGRRDYAAMQIVITARDHVCGPWLNWLPRIGLSELSDDQVYALVRLLLDNNDGETEKFFSQLKKVAVLQPLMRVPLLGTLAVAVYRNQTALPEGKVELYRIFVDLLCGGWDMAKNVKRESDFGSAVKLRVLMRLATVLHGARTRVGTSAAFRSVVKETAPVLLGHSEALLGDIIQDGLLTRNGPTFAFSHLSFQEYLVARDLAEPTNVGQDEALLRYLTGDDWWNEVMAFYVAISRRPRDTERWLTDVTRRALRGSSRVSVEEIAARSELLAQVIVDCSPAYSRQCAEALEEEVRSPQQNDYQPNEEVWSEFDALLDDIQDGNSVRPNRKELRVRKGRRRPALGGI